MKAGLAPVLIVMGVSGTGKTTMAGLLAGRLGWPLLEGDDLHPAANIAKMTAGTPLTDLDREPWLDAIAQWIADRARARQPGVVACSALKRVYRDRIRSDSSVLVHLHASPDLIARRLSARVDHFMPAPLLRSQIEAFEPPGDDEPHVTVDVGGPPDELAQRVIEVMGLTPGG